MALTDAFDAMRIAADDHRQTRALGLPFELLLRIIGFDLAGTERLSERLQRETMLALVCADFADVVRATRPASADGGVGSSAVVSQRGLERLARLAEDGPTSGADSAVTTLRRLFARLPYRCGQGQQSIDDVFEPLERVFAAAVGLHDLEIMLSSRPLPTSLVLVISSLANLRSLSLRACDCSAEFIAQLLSMSPQSLEVDQFAARRMHGDGGRPMYAAEVRMVGVLGARQFLGQLLALAGQRFLRLSIDIDGGGIGLNVPGLD